MLSGPNEQELFFIQVVVDFVITKGAKHKVILFTKNEWKDLCVDALLQDKEEIWLKTN